MLPLFPAQGLTGFGSGILNLCTWIVFMVAGVQSGSLQQAVVCEALASTLIAPGLLYVTRAHATADLKVVAAISLFVVRVMLLLLRAFGGSG